MEPRERVPPRGWIPDSYGLEVRMERKLRTIRGKEIHKRRRQSVEPVIEQFVNRGLDRLLLRGEKAAKVEWSYSQQHTPC